MVTNTLATSLALLLLAPAFAAAEDLTFIATDLDSNRGQVLCTLYDSAGTWLEATGYVETVAATPSGRQATCVFEDVDPGTYAVFFMHDVNGNGDMDMNLFGLPTEPWGTSRDAPSLLGPPRFRRASFTHPSTSTPTGRAR